MHSMSPVLGLIFCGYSTLSEVETVERERNILNESIMNILREKRKLQKSRKS